MTSINFFLKENKINIFFKKTHKNHHPNICKDSPDYFKDVVNNSLFRKKCENVQTSVTTYKIEQCNLKCMWLFILMYKVFLCI